MSRYSDFIGSKKEEKQPEPANVLHGAWNCGRCGQKVKTAIHDKKNGTISWVCDDGHETKIAIEL